MMKYVANKIVNFIKNKRQEKKLKKLYREIIDGKWDEKDKFAEEISYLRLKGELQVFPYTFSEQYHRRVELFEKDEKGVFVELENRKKLYFNCDDKEKASHIYRNLCREQDIHSAHRYYAEGFYPTSEDNYIDIGCAEGQEALLAADVVKKIYLFEGNSSWQNVLNNSFSDYDEKTRIVSCFVGKEDKSPSIQTLDSFFGTECTGEKYFIKMDVEGAEKDVLFGGA